MISPYHTTHPSRPALARKQTTERGTSAEQGMIQADSPSDNQDGKGKARARINMACIHCRHRKIRCDGAQPSCATCVRLHRECEYEPVTEYENLISRERKRRNKEKKAARMASHGIFAGQSPLSMLHPGASLGLPPAPLAHYVDLPQQNMAPLFLSIPDSRLEGQGVESQIRPRRRRGISDIPAVHLQHRLGPLASPLPPSSFQHASVSQPSTPAQAYRYYPALAFSPAQQHVAPNVPAELFSGPLSAPLIPPSNSSPFFAAPLPAPSQSQQQQMMASPHVIDLIGLSSASSLPALPSSSASATEADFNYGMIDLTGIPTAIPTSAHVRPVDLPAPHGHFDFASVPFPTQDTFAAELPISALRRRSSIHLPVGTAHAFRRPSVAEVATAALMQKVAVKRTEKVNTDIKALTADLVDSDATGIVAWNAHVQSQLPASLANWSGFNSAIESAEEYTVPNTLPLSRSNSEGLLSLRPLSPTPYVSGVDD
uniref:C6 transcription factor n=1 Tax=Melanopsichium pennsylvanicum 4 TaxID=1398559 RepID=A0A077QR53_9BASI|nr:c6 transcription factor [Melanopsichium pennsylvanicum 4]